MREGVDDFRPRRPVPLYPYQWRLMTHRTFQVSIAFNLLFLALGLGAWVGPNVQTSFNPTIARPIVFPNSIVHTMASVMGSVELGQRVFVAPFASIRGDEGQHIRIGDDSNVQDGVVIHGLETFDAGRDILDNVVTVEGRKYSVYVGDRVSLAHQSQVHGPVRIGNDTFVGMQSLIFRSELGDHVVVEPGAKVIGVSVPSHRYVPIMTVVTTQAQADALPVITDQYAYRNLNHAIVHVNTQLADPQTARRLSRTR